MRLSKRDRLACWLTSLGITRTLELVGPRRSLLVVNYHRIGKPEEAKYDAALYEATAEAFSQQVQLLQRRYHLVSLAEATELILQPSRLRHRHVLITFDDGYRDNFDLALPVLRAHGATAVFFLATSFIGTNRIPWWDQIADIVLRSSRETIEMEYPERRSLTLQPNPRRAIRALIQLYRSPAMQDPGRFWASVAAATGTERRETVEDRQFITWDEAREMVRAGMDVGAHTHSHELLAKQTAEQQLWEITESRRIIREQVGVQVDSLAYPVGLRGCYDDVTIDCLRQAGFRTAFSFLGRANFPPHIQPLDVERVAVDHMHLDHFRLRKALYALGFPPDKVEGGPSAR